TLSNPCSSAVAPAGRGTHSTDRPAASITRVVAAVTSGPIPSPAMRTMVCLAMVLDDTRGALLAKSAKSAAGLKRIVRDSQFQLARAGISEKKLTDRAGERMARALEKDCDRDRQHGGGEDQCEVGCEGALT